MKEMREKKIAAYLDVTARVSNAKRAVRRADVARVLFTASPEGGMHYGSSEEVARSEEEARAQDSRGKEDDGEEDGHSPS